MLGKFREPFREDEGFGGSLVCLFPSDNQLEDMVKVLRPCSEGRLQRFHEIEKLQHLDQRHYVCSGCKFGRVV